MEKFAATEWLDAARTISRVGQCAHRRKDRGWTEDAQLAALREKLRRQRLILQLTAFT